MDVKNLKQIKLSSDTLTPHGFNIPQDNLSFLPSDSDESPDCDMISDDERDEDDINYCVSESNNTTDTESIDEFPIKKFPYQKAQPLSKKFPDELSPETDFVDE